MRDRALPADEFPLRLDYRGVALHFAQHTDGSTFGYKVLFSPFGREPVARTMEGSVSGSARAAYEAAVAEAKACVDRELGNPE